MDEIIPFQQHAEQLKRARPMPPQISKLASVDPKAKISSNVEIGPFCVVGPDVSIGRGTILRNNVTLSGRVTLGCENLLHPNVVIGGEPQDVHYDGTPTEVIVGDRNEFRECVTVNRATTKENLVTSVGDDCYFMGCVHVGHDCVVGNNVIIANGTMLGGHVHVFDRATISGAVGIHHYTRVGEYSFVTGVGRVIQDVPPFMLVEGNPSKPRCVNVIALKRNNFPNDIIKSISEAYRLLYRSRVGLENAKEILRGKKMLNPHILRLLDYVDCQQGGKHGRGRESTRKAA